MTDYGPKTRLDNVDYGAKMRPGSYDYGALPYESFTPDAQAFISAAGITNPTQQNAINQLVIDLKAASVWTKLPVIYPMVGGTAAFHKWNLKDPRDLDAAYRLVFSGTWSHASTGVTPTSSHADTFFNPSTNSAAWKTSNSLLFYSRTSAAAGDGWVMGVGDTSTGNPLFGLAIRRTTGGLNIYDSGNVATGRAQASPLNGLGLTSGSCTSATSRKLYRNGAVSATNVTSDTANASNASIYLGALRATAGSTLYQDNECAFAAIGDGLTDAEMSAIYTAVQAYQTTLSRQV